MASNKQSGDDDSYVQAVSLSIGSENTLKGLIEDDDYISSAQVMYENALKNSIVTPAYTTQLLSVIKNNHEKSIEEKGNAFNENELGWSDSSDSRKRVTTDRDVLELYQSLIQIQAIHPPSRSTLTWRPDIDFFTEILTNLSNNTLSKSSNFLSSSRKRTRSTSSASKSSPSLTTQDTENLLMILELMVNIFKEEEDKGTEKGERILFEILEKDKKKDFIPLYFQIIDHNPHPKITHLIQQLLHFSCILYDDEQSFQFPLWISFRNMSNIGKIAFLNTNVCYPHTQIDLIEFILDNDYDKSLIPKSTANLSKTQLSLQKITSCYYYLTPIENSRAGKTTTENLPSVHANVSNVEVLCQLLYTLSKHWLAIENEKLTLADLETLKNETLAMSKRVKMRMTTKEKGNPTLNSILTNLVNMIEVNVLLKQ